MKTVQMDVTTRMLVENILRAQRGTIEDMEVPRDILSRIKVPQEERDLLVRTVRGGVVVDQEAIDATPKVDVEFEKEEVKRLTKILTEWQGASTEDYEYLSVFLKALKD